MKALSKICSSSAPSTPVTNQFSRMLLLACLMVFCLAGLLSQPALAIRAPGVSVNVPGHGSYSVGSIAVGSSSSTILVTFNFKETVTLNSSTPFQVLTLGASSSSLFRPSTPEPGRARSR